MKKLLLASVALVIAGIVPVMAADLPVKAAPAPAAAAYGDPWSGFYIGANFGYGWDRGAGNAIDPINGMLVDSFKTAPQGFLGGGHIGWGQRFANIWYFGLEGDADITSIDGDVNGGVSTGFISATSKNRWLASIRARLGVIPVGHAMLYATGGYGWGSNTFTVADVFGNSASTSATLGGFVGGAGIEIPFSSNWLGRVEYLHYALGDLSVNNTMAIGGVAGSGVPFNTTVANRVDVVRAGLSYKF